MKTCRINPVDLIEKHYSELQDRYSTSTNPLEKKVLYKRLLNLHEVKHFITSTTHLHQIVPARPGRFVGH